MSVNLSPVGGAGAQFFDNNGNPLSGGKLYTYSASTTTPAATYTSTAGAVQHTNPIVLDSGGRVPSGGEIWLTDNVSYKFVLKTSADALVATWDNINGINSNFVNYTVQEEIIVATAGQTVFNLSTITYTPATNSLSVFVDGVNQILSNSYVETDSNTVTFVSGLHVGAEVKFTTAIPATGTATDASVVSYTPAGAGAVATTVQAKLRESVSVKDFGAVGDGVTDDTAAIEAAILECKGSDKPALYFPAGVYCFTESTPNFGLYINEAITIYGDGPTRTTLKNTSATGAGVRCAGGWITISDLTIDNNSSTGIAFRMGGQYSVTRNLRIKNQAGGSFAFVADGSTLASIYDLHLENCSNGISIAATTPTQYLTFTNVSVEIASGEAITIGTSTSIKFYGLYIEPINGVTTITHAIKATGAIDLNFYELSAEVFGGLTGPSQAWMEFISCKSVNVYGGRIYNSVASNNTIFYQVSGAGTRNINFDGLELQSVGTGQTLFNVTDNPYQISWKNITTNGSASGTGINYDSSGNGLSVVNWHNSNSAYSFDLDSNDVFISNVANNIDIENRTNMVLVNCQGSITGTGAANVTQLDNFIAVPNSFRPKTDQTVTFGAIGNRWLNIFSDKLALTDGVTAPGTVAGAAQIYVDTADGDLKVKFGDGTVKTIATNP